MYLVVPPAVRGKGLSRMLLECVMHERCAGGAEEVEVCVT